VDQPQGKTKVSPTKGISWEKRIENALMFGHFISWREVSEFRDDLGRLLDELISFAAKRPKDALPIYEIFIAGCLEKGDEIDDSGNDLGSFLDELACSWTRCCSESRMKGDEYLRKLAHWVKADSIGFFFDLESTVIPSLSKEYREALEGELKKRLDTLSTETPQTPDREPNKINADHRSTIETLKRLYTETRNTTALIEFCERYGVDQKDCFDLANMFHNRNQLDRALEWAERGLKLKDNRLLKHMS
jgi:hypothetical protein